MASTRLNELQIYSDELSVTINPVGAEIFSIQNRAGLEYIWQANKAIWPRHAPVLFPIVGRLKEDAFHYNGQTYQLGQHGFARDLEFVLIWKNDHSCCFKLQSTLQTKTSFPFDFDLQITYQLDHNRITCSYQVLNPSQGPIFFSLGAHPGFNCPMQAGEKFEDYYLDFQQTDLVYTSLEEGMRTSIKQTLPLENGKLFLRSELFDNDALVFEDAQVQTVRLASLSSPHSVQLRCSNWPYFGVWTKKGNTQFICLEPWFGVADRINTNSQLPEKDGIVKLNAGLKFKCSFSLTCL